MRRLMKYYIVSGRTVEERRSWMSVGEKPKKTRGTRKVGNSTEKKIRANEKSTVRKLARILNCNYEAGDGFLTLAYDGSHYPAGSSPDPDQRREEEYQASKRILTKKFLPKLGRVYRKVTGKKLTAVWVTANWSPRRDAPTRVHHHMVLPTDAVELARKLWQRFGGAGTVKIEDLNNEGDYSRLAAYMLENVKGRPYGENKWSGTRGLAQPIYCGWEEVTDIEDVQPLPGSIVKDVEQSQDEEGQVIGAYLRCVLPERVKVRGGQVVLPRKRRRRA